MNANRFYSQAYSPPFYASKMEGFGVIYGAPRPPFILAKMFWRKALSAFLLPTWFVVGVVFRFVATVCGFDPWMFVHWEEQARTTARASASVMGFGADELL